MKNRVFLIFPVFLLALASAARLAPRDPGPAANLAQPAGAPDASGDQIIVYYFYTQPRCVTCREIEELTQETLRAHFSVDLEQGRILWRPVNTGDEANKHFVEDYQLFTKAVIVAELQQGKQVRWKNLQKVWELSHDREGLVEYVRGEVSAYLGGS